MNCIELRTSLELLLDGEVDMDTKSIMLSHIHDCVDCHAVWAEQRTLKDYLHSYQSIIRTPQHLRGKIREMLLGYPPSSEALKLVQKEDGFRAATSSVSLAVHDGDAAKLDSNEQNQNSIGDFVDDVLDQLPSNSITSQLLQKDLNEALSKLSPRERDLMRLRFGLDDGKQCTLEEVAKMYGVTRERIRQIESKALSKLRAPLKHRGVRKFGE